MTAAGVVGHGDHAKRNALTLRLEQRLHPRQINIAFERVNQRRLQPFGDDQIDRLNADVFEVGAGGVKVRIVGHQIAFFADGGEQHLFSGAPLVRRHKVLHAGDALNDGLQPVKTARPGVAFVAFHDGAPLARRHRAGARIGQPVDQHIFSAELENIELGRLQQLHPLLARGHANRLDALDAERFNQGFRHGNFSK